MESVVTDFCQMDWDFNKNSIIFNKKLYYEKLFINNSQRECAK